MRVSAAVLLNNLIEALVQVVAKVVRLSYESAVSRPQSIIDNAANDLIVGCLSEVDRSKKLTPGNGQLPRFVQQAFHFLGDGRGVWSETASNAIFEVFGHIEVFSKPPLKYLGCTPDAEASLSNQASFLTRILNAGLMSLPDWNSDTNHQCRNASNSLNPSCPLFGSEVWQCGILRRDCPDEECSSAERHNCNHRPVSVGPSVLHDFPPLMDRILPLGVAA